MSAPLGQGCPRCPWCSAAHPQGSPAAPPQACAVLAELAPTFPLLALNHCSLLQLSLNNVLGTELWNTTNTLASSR